MFVHLCKSMQLCICFIVMCRNACVPKKYFVCLNKPIQCYKYGICNASRPSGCHSLEMMRAFGAKAVICHFLRIKMCCTVSSIGIAAECRMWKT